MKIVTYGPVHRIGALTGNNKLIDLNRGSAQLPARLVSFIEAGKPALDEAARVIDKFANPASASDDIVHSLDQVQLHAPWPERRIACVGGNYAKHLLGMWANRLGKTDVTIDDVTSEAKKAGQWGFWKVPAEVAGPADTIPFPKRVTYFDYEGEVAIIIGRRGKDIRAANIRDYVW